MLARVDRPLVYVHPVPVPAAAANSVQVVSMCESFGRLHPDVRLAAVCASDVDLASHYGIESTFRLLPLTPAKIRGSAATRAVGAIVRRLGRDWTCYTRVAPVAAATSLLGIPTFLELHGLPEYRHHRFAVRVAGRRATLLRVVVISDALRHAYAAEHLVPPEKLLVAHDAATLYPDDDTPISKLRREFGLPETGSLVGYAGSLKTDKGVEVLLQAVTSHRHLEVAVAGTRPPQAFTDLTARYAHPRVHFVGQVRPSNVHRFLRACDVVAAPFVRKAHRTLGSGRTARSVSIHEYMSPLKIFEAMASGRPLVVSDLPVIREVVTPDHDCLLVPPGNVGALGDALESVLDDPMLAHRLADSARTTVTNFTWDRRAAEVLAASAVG